MGAEVLMAFALLAEKQCYPVRQYVFDGGPFFHFPKPVQFVMEKKFQGLAGQLRGKEGPETVKKLPANPMVQKLIGTDTAPYQEMGTDMTRVCQTADRVSIRNMVRTCYTFGFHAVKPEVQKRFYFLWSEKEPARKSEKKMRETYPPRPLPGRARLYALRLPDLRPGDVCAGDAGTFGEAKMKLKKMDWPAVLIEMLNCIIVQYALSNMAILLHANLLFVLLFMAKMWTWSSCWRKMDDLCGNKVLSAVLTAGCIAAEMGLFCFVGHVDGEIVSF